MWKRHVDDILKVVKIGMTQLLTDDLNRVDETNSIKFMHEEETYRMVLFGYLTGKTLIRVDIPINFFAIITTQTNTIFFPTSFITPEDGSNSYVAKQM